MMGDRHRCAGFGRAAVGGRQIKKNAGETGAVTAEFAVVLPAVIFVLALLLGLAATGVTQVKLEESARLGARAAARGESSQTVQRIAGDIDSAITVSVTRQGSDVRVSSSRRAPGIIGDLTGWEQRAEATVPGEQVP